MGVTLFLFCQLSGYATMRGWLKRGMTKSYNLHNEKETEKKGREGKKERKKLVEKFTPQKKNWSRKYREEEKRSE